MPWTDSFRTLHAHAVAHYQQGRRGSETFFDVAQTAELAAIGHTAQELYDFAEDAVKSGEPTADTALLIAAARRDYFLLVQGGQRTDQEIDMETLPPKDAKVDDIPWLPRLIEKAKAKLQGEMPADLMFGCGGDRNFFREWKLDGADFLRAAWLVDFDATALARWVRGGPLSK